MPPIGDSHVAPSPTGSDVIGNEVAATETDTPSPPPATPSPPPPPPQVEDLPYLRELHPFVPYAPFPGDPGDCLPLNTSLPQVLKQVSGKEDLQEVFDLKLRVIAREMSLQRLCCHVPNLRELSLDGSCLVSLRDLGCGLVHLEVLRIARCGLDSLDGLFGLLSLRELHAAGNHVDDVSPCTVLRHIRRIDLRGNRVSDITYVSFLSFCNSLQHLVLAECPAAECGGYREEVKRFLPQLVTLDGEPLQPPGNDAGPDLNLQEDTDDDDDGFVDDGIDDWVTGGDGGGAASGTSGGFANVTCQETAGGREREKGKTTSVKKALNLVRSVSPATTASEVCVSLPPRCSSSCEKNTRQALVKKDAAARCSSAMAGCRDGGGTGDAGGGGVGSSSSSGVDDVPSRLTSGPPLCGDLATSLRRNRKLRPWTVKNDADRHKNPQPVGLCSEVNDDEVLKSSRRLHELYQNMRDEQRLQLQGEQDDGEVDEEGGDHEGH